VLTLSGDEGGPAASESIQHKSAALGAIHDGIGDERQRLNGGMQAKLGVPILAETVHAGIVPDIAAIAAETPERHIVDVRRVAVLKHEYEFVL